MDEAVIQTQGITKIYGKAAAVAELSIQVQRGDIYALVGQNGAGKTTLLKLVCGLTPPTAGSLTLLGSDSAQQLSAARAHMGTMIETPGFLPYLSAHDNLEYYRIQRGMTDKNAVQRSLEFVGLADTGHKKFRNFSLGMKQRLGLALAMMNDPDLLILDEPINGLDPMGIKEFRDIILRLNHEKRTTVLISSHILGELSQIATTYGFIHHGKLVQHISAPQLQEKCRSCLRVDVDDPGKAQQILKEQLGLIHVEAVQPTVLHIHDTVENPAAAVKALVESGVMVSRVAPTGINLEQYFIQLIGGNENA